MTAAPLSRKAATVEQAIRQAVTCHQAGQLQDAENLYLAILQVAPQHADVNHNLGVLAVHGKRPAAGLPHFEAALAANPVSEQYWLSYIDALIQAGLADLARQVLAVGRRHGLHGKSVEALALRLEIKNAEKPGKSIGKANTRRGAKPPLLEVHVLGTLFNQGRFQEMETAARELTLRFPKSGIGWKALGAALQRQARNAEALAPLRNAAELLQGDPETHNNLGNALRDRGQLVEAEASYRRALTLKRDYAEAHSNLGNVLKDLGRLDDAVAHCRRALEIKPALAEACHNLGVALRELGRLDDAVANARRALQIKPDYADAHHNLGVALRDQKKLDESLQHHQRALALAPDNDDVRFGLGLLHLFKGDLKQGWAGYEYRFTKRIEPIKKREFALPHWQGESLADKNLLVWGEQGVGDEIWFSGLVPELIERARRCTLLCSPKLVSLFTRSFPNAHVTARIDATGPADGFDVQVAAGSVARWLRPTLASFPDRPSYLIADPQRVAYWRERLVEIGGGLKVGFCWRSSLSKGERALDYSGLSQWGPIFAVPGVHFVNLQYDECGGELDRARNEFGVTLHHFPEVNMFDDLDETAALMNALDLVISAPTTVGIQAAALGLACWQMSSDRDWSALGAEHNPWFPTMRCFWRAWQRPWPEIIEQIAWELRRAARARG